MTKTERWLILRDGIHELRARLGHVNYRILYSIHGRVVAVLLHALVKEDVVPEADIDLAVVRKNAFARERRSRLGVRQEKRFGAFDFRARIRCRGRLPDDGTRRW
ncbi:MAG TPA: type II toxin-antitoxin system RelE/ParE family toxin [Gemmatimonadales bacterium]|nr:type II toxin-antitoxin system RelE/ParE family toxin [Gemmatimonadales bacterium]HYT83408.1 type II toxin-antitoxin system RelE/ParE family toxin [Gemmatimonadales bacterium]